MVISSFIRYKDLFDKEYCMNVYIINELSKSKYNLSLNRYRRKCPKVDASIYDSVLSHTRRSDAWEKEMKIACPLLDIFACGEVSSPRPYRLSIIFFKTISE